MKYLFALVFSPLTMALTFKIDPNTTVIGDVTSIEANQATGLAEIGREHNIGAQEIKSANPALHNIKDLDGQEIILPTQFILPAAERKGIVINLAEMRLYYYDPNGKKVYTYPIGIGKEGWGTPVGETRITTKREKPTWTIPESIKESAERQGKILPDAIPPGPNNPLGDYAMNLGIGGIMIHGTLMPEGIGMRSSHGCIRMLNPDVEELFHMVEINTPVRIVHQPIKVGVESSDVLVEVHKPLHEDDYEENLTIENLIELISKYAPKASIDWKKAEVILKEKTGIPSKVGEL